MLEGHNFCPLHTPFTNDADFQDDGWLWLLKETEVSHKIKLGDFNFEGAKLNWFQTPIQITGDINFNDAEINGYASFENVKIDGDACFQDAKFKGPVIFSGMEITKFANFNGAEFLENVSFDNVHFHKDADFNEAKFNGEITSFFKAIFINSAWFNDVKFGEEAESINFNQAIFKGCVWFNYTQFGKNVNFKDSKFESDALFVRTKFGGSTTFSNAEFGRRAGFTGAEFGKDVWFEDVKFNGDAIFYDVKFGNRNCGGNVVFQGSYFRRDAKFNGALFFSNLSIIPIHSLGSVNLSGTMFSSPKMKEDACRVAKNQCINLGDNHEADIYYYNEMEGKRKQKPKCRRWLEYIFIQSIFGYGVKPLRTFCFWVVTILIFALIYYNFQTLESGSEFFEYLYFSATTAMTPGFGGYKVITPWQLLALIEAFFGTFMWAAFITIFARKYMR